MWLNQKQLAELLDGRILKKGTLNTIRSHALNQKLHIGFQEINFTLLLHQIPVSWIQK